MTWQRFGHRNGGVDHHRAAPAPYLLAAAMPFQDRPQLGGVLAEVVAGPAGKPAPQGLLIDGQADDNVVPGHPVPPDADAVLVRAEGGVATAGQLSQHC